MIKKGCMYPLYGSTFGENVQFCSGNMCNKYKWSMMEGNKTFLTFGHSYYYISFTNLLFSFIFFYRTQTEEVEKKIELLLIFFQYQPYQDKKIFFCLFHKEIILQCNNSNTYSFF